MSQNDPENVAAYALLDKLAAAKASGNVNGPEFAAAEADFHAFVDAYPPGAGSGNPDPAAGHANVDASMAGIKAALAGAFDAVIVENTPEWPRPDAG